MTEGAFLGEKDVYGVGGIPPLERKTTWVVKTHLFLSRVFHELYFWALVIIASLILLFPCIAAQSFMKLERGLLRAVQI